MNAFASFVCVVAFSVCASGITSGIGVCAPFGAVGAFFALAQFPGVLKGADVDLVRSILAALLVVPFVLFSPLAGWLNDRFAKSRVLNAALGMQFGVMVLLIGALWLRSLWGAGWCFLLLALQATVFAPAKRGILRELVGHDAQKSLMPGLERVLPLAFESKHAD